MDREVYQFAKTVAVWSGGKPIVLGEFGALSGVPDRAIRDRHVHSPQTQAAHIAIQVTALQRARRDGVNLTGALLWILAPRGNETVDGWSVFLPQGPGKTLTVLPGLAALTAPFATPEQHAFAQHLIADPPQQLPPQ
jgi:hypothetical protein